MEIIVAIIRNRFGKSNISVAQVIIFITDLKILYNIILEFRFKYISAGTDGSIELGNVELQLYCITRNTIRLLKLVS